MQKLEATLSTFEKKVEQAIEAAWAKETLFSHLEALTAQVGEVVEAAVAVGDYSLEQLTFHQELAHYAIHFLWGEQVKSFLVLWRDMVFQQHKGGILLADGLVSIADIENLKQTSLTVIQAAAQDLEGGLKKTLTSIEASSMGAERQFADWKLQHNPWPTYRTQLLQIPQQCQQLLAQHHQLTELSEIFLRVERLVDQSVTDCKEEVEQMKSTADEIIRFVEGMGELKPNKIALKLEESEAAISSPNHLKAFTEKLKSLTLRLPERTQVYVYPKGGLLQFKEINFRRMTRQWVDSEVLPMLYEIWELTESVTNGMKMSLVNIRNRAILLATEPQDGASLNIDKSAIYQPLTTFLKGTDDWEAELTALKTQIDDRLKKEFHLSLIYDPQEDFLPIHLQSTINQLKINQNALLSTIQSWFRKQLQAIKRFRTTVAQEEAMSASEKIVRFVQSRTADENNSQYTNIFLTKGYIGESFWVGRKQEITHIEKLISNWDKGFRGAVVITGDRFAGKSVFGDLVANRHFPQHVIRLVPDTIIKVQGRRMTLGYDLGEALEFVRKYSLNTRTMVWIDDLEFWQDVKMPLGRNVRQLRKHIDNYTNDLFYMVSMSNGLKAYLDKFYEIHKVFQSEVNLDHMSVSEIQEAILIRHGATHKTLVDVKGKEVSPKQFQQMTQKVFRSAHGNIGEALNRWAFSTEKVDDERVIHHTRTGYGLPDFITPDSLVLLKILMLEKRTNEYRLRKLFGAPFKEKYGNILHRLLGLGIVQRQLTGWLEVNELIVNDLGIMLKQKQS